jgi:hypothetical protein
MYHVSSLTSPFLFAHYTHFTVTATANSPVVAYLSPRFGYRRSFCVQSAHFTALGVVRRPEAVAAAADEQADAMCGILFALADDAALAACDERERESGYKRVEVPMAMLRVPDAAGRDKLMRTCAHVWIYVPIQETVAAATESCPILQSYVDVCLQGG